MYYKYGYLASQIYTQLDSQRDRLEQLIALQKAELEKADNLDEPEIRHHLKGSKAALKQLESAISKLAPSAR